MLFLPGKHNMKGTSVWVGRGWWQCRCWCVREWQLLTLPSCGRSRKKRNMYAWRKKISYVVWGKGLSYAIIHKSFNRTQGKLKVWSQLIILRSSNSSNNIEGAFNIFRTMDLATSIYRLAGWYCWILKFNQFSS